MTRILAICALFLLTACASHPPAGDKGPKPRDENYHGGPNALLLKFDANHDGILTRAELDAGLKAAFAADGGGKSCLNADQVAQINQERVAADQSTATPLMDWNQDGCVDLAEYSAAALSLFVQLDRNGDGKVEPKEFNPAARPSAGPGPAQGSAGDASGRRGNRRPPPQ
jgi:hypothetical protein